MKRKLRIGKRCLGFVLALAMFITTVGFCPVTAQAVTNAFAPTVDTHGATYDAENGEVTFWVKSADACYAATQTFWYKEYASYEEAAANHISTGANFIEHVNATTLAENTTGTEKTYTINVSDGTGAVLYYFNAGVGHERHKYEHIIVIGDESDDEGAGGSGGSDGDNTGGTGSGGSGSADSGESIPAIIFSDIEENTADWKYVAALYAVGEGLMTGVAVDEETGVITFDPLGDVTRAQFVTILYNAAGTPNVEYSDTFSDVTDITKWYAKPVLWAAENGVVAGKPDGTFGVNEKVTRQDMAVMLMNYADYCEYKPDEVEGADLSGYPDESSVSNYAKTAMQWANKMGIINGKSTSAGINKLDPKGTATRAEAATVMKNFITAYADYSDADKPVLRTDIVPRDDQMFFQFNNKTGGEYSDSEIYWCILGFDPETMKLCYLNTEGELIPATTALNTITKGDRKCADIFYTLEEKDYVYMPDITSGRMYISYGSPVYVTINSDINGNIGFAGPDLNNPTDPNQDVLFEFVEFTITEGVYWGNTTRVDFFSFPVVSRLIGEGGFVSTPGDADTFDKTVGDIGTRDEIFAAFKAEVPDEFKTLVQDLRIMAPCKATFNENQQYGDYFDDYIDEIWTKFSTQDLVFECQAGTFRGRVSGNQMIFTQDGGESNIVVNKPTTQDAFEGKGTLATGRSIELVVQAQLCAAINRGVAHTPEKWADSSAFYQNEVANYYAGFFHRHSIDGLAYGFCYDDVFDYSTLLHYTEPTALVIDLKW